jgi:spore coat protein CotH
VGLRVKGSSSFEPIDQKPSLRINIDEYVPDAEFFGLKDLTLNNMHSDQSMMHERMGYWIARLAGLPASRSSHALVSLNGQPAALYANVETVKRRMLKRWFNNPDGALYEATEVDFTTTNALYPHADGRPRDDIPLYELKGKVDDRSLLYSLARALTMPSPDQAMAAAASYLNVDQFINFWAVTALIGNFDVMPYSIPGDDYFVYANPDDRKIYLLPWGIDETFEAGDTDVVRTVYSVLAKTCSASPACLQQFVNRVWALMDKLEAMNWHEERVRIAQQIAPHTRADQRKSYTDAQVFEQQENMKYFLRERRMTLGNFIPLPR